MNDDTVSNYIHGTEPEEQIRLALLNDLLNRGSLRELDLHGGERIVDIGCGLGQFSRAMGRIAGVPVVGIERSAAQILEGQRLAERAGEGSAVSFRQGDASQPPLRPEEWGQFDVAHARFVLEHLRDPLAAVQAMVRAVRPGGRIVLEDDDHDLMRLAPEPSGFPALWSAYQASYEYLGNDPRIGRRLVSLLLNAGALPVRNAFIFFGSCAGEQHFPLYVDNLVGVIQGTRSIVIESGFLDASRFDAAVIELQKWSEDPAAAIWYAVSWAEGIRHGR
jgi:SAM-dependent methyltransferase